jgi:hypothetical protein
MKTRWICLLSGAAVGGAEFILGWLGPADCMLRACAPWVLASLLVPVLILVLCTAYVTRRLGRLRFSSMAALAVSATTGMLSAMLVLNWSDTSVVFTIISMVVVGFPAAFVIVVLSWVAVIGFWPPCLLDREKSRPLVRIRRARQRGLEAPSRSP